MKVLVTGANGQLGQTIQGLFSINKDHIEFVFVNKSELNIANTIQVEDFFNKNNFAYCINCAAYTNVEEAEINIKTAFKINAEGALNIAKACKRHHIILIHISTDYVFDGDTDEPYKEDDPTNPINEYGKSKLQGEFNIAQTLESYFIIRTSWLYSPYGKNFVKTIFNKLNDNSDLKITTSQIGTPTSCDELAKFIYFLIKTKQNRFGIYHFTALGKTTWYDFAIQISKQLVNNTSNIVPTNIFKSKAKRPNYSVLDNSKVLHIFPNIKPWKKGVDDTVKQLLALK
jgi:dTDP-4-dehydrorhamnose reductase